MQHMPINRTPSHDMPFLLPGQIVSIPGQGEMFVRHFQHSDATAPTVLLLHGWTASCDLQFYTAYEELARHFSVIGVDHRGHGRGLRPDVPVTLEDCADDAAAAVRALGIESVITIGYSMGGPISMFFAQRHADLVNGMVLQATALEWSGTRKEKNRMRFIGPMSHLVGRPRVLRWFMKRTLPRGHETRRYMSWIIAENRRNDPWMIAEAGKAIARFDARGFAPTLNVPASYVLTLRDTLVLPHKQHALASAVKAQIVELDGDHMAPIVMPREFAAATRQAVNLVVAAIQQR
ncbi:MAG: alpha/beta fold hydrolase [Actinobacteria bacterium]|nr:alpha/beta fold hydrolase [Actinomycetota bacterium]